MYGVEESQIVTLRNQVTKQAIVTRSAKQVFLISSAPLRLVLTLIMQLNVLCFFASKLSVKLVTPGKHEKQEHTYELHSSR